MSNYQQFQNAKLRHLARNAGQGSAGDRLAGKRLTGDIPLPILSRMEGNVWWVAHTKPRCEKKLAQYCKREGLDATLPCYKSHHRYRGKTAVFVKPLFPGYVFLQIEDAQRRSVLQSEYVANLLAVTDQELFARQLEEILTALDSEVEVRLAPAIGIGMRVQIKSGPLRGLEGWVENRTGPKTVLLRLDFIGQAAAVKVEAWDLEPS